jgi:hypothetical protein
VQLTRPATRNHPADDRQDDVARRFAARKHNFGGICPGTIPARRGIPNRYPIAPDSRCRSAIATACSSVTSLYSREGPSSNSRHSEWRMNLTTTYHSRSICGANDSGALRILLKRCDIAPPIPAVQEQPPNLHGHGEKLANPPDEWAVQVSPRSRPCCSRCRRVVDNGFNRAHPSHAPAAAALVVAAARSRRGKPRVTPAAR